MSWHGALDFDAGSEAGAPVSGQSGQQSDMSIAASAAIAIEVAIAAGGVACAIDWPEKPVRARATRRVRIRVHMPMRTRLRPPGGVNSGRVARRGPDQAPSTAPIPRQG